MSPQQQFDAVIIGAGVAGLATAALLARDAAQRVLVLERAPFIGGRTLSYVGRGNKVVADGVEMIERAKAKKQGIVWVAQEYRYMPPVAEMIRKLDDGTPDGRLARRLCGLIFLMLHTSTALAGPRYTCAAPSRQP